MAKSRREKNKELYNQLENEMKNSKENSYEEKLKNIDPNLNADGEENLAKEKVVVNKKNDAKNSSALTVIAKKVNGEKTLRKNELVKVEPKTKKEVQKVIEEEDFKEPVSFTDKLSVEEILRAKLEQQQKLKANKKGVKKSPNDDSYTPSMMQQRIKQHEGVDVRKEVKLRHKDYRGLALTVLIVSLISVIIIGLLLIFKVI